MAVNKLLPFANGNSANVVDYATWSALTQILGQGFTTGVARSDYANRVFSQGALASYVLGQFVVDQTAQDADLNESVFYTNFKNALINYIKQNAVSLNTAQTVGGVKTFTSIPIVPTADAADNSQKVATTAFVQGEIASKANASEVVKLTGNQTIAGVKTFSDSPEVPTPASGNNSQKVASTGFVQNAVSSQAVKFDSVQTLTDAQKAQARTNIDAPANSDVVHLIGNESVSGVKTFADSPIVPTADEADYSQKSANTAFVQTRIRKTADDLQKQINALEGTVLTATEDATEAYSKAIPTSANLFKYAAIRNFGGRSIVWNQLVDSSTSTVTLISGRKYITVIGGTWTLVTGDGSSVSVSPGTDQVFDLTLMFGAGNEPATVADFLAIFPNDIPAFNAGEIKSAGVNKIVSKDSNSVEIAAKTIPQAILDLPGYGWSAGSAKNWVDWENKVYHQEVAQVDLGDLSWTVRGTGSSKRVLSSTLPALYLPNGNTPVNWISSDGYCGATNAAALLADVDSNVSGVYSYAGTSPENALYAVVNSTTATSANGKLNYELATPIETDISALIDDNTIEVESGGSLTFENTNGDSYRIPVPSSLVTMEKP